MIVPDETIEAMARIIDPSSWRVFDTYLAEVKRKYAGQDAAYDPEAFKDKASIAKARAIVALLPQPPVSAAPEGWRDIASAPLNGTHVLLAFGQDHVSEGWWEDADPGAHPWKFIKAVQDHRSPTASY